MEEDDTKREMEKNAHLEHLKLSYVAKQPHYFILLRSCPHTRSHSTPLNCKCFYKKEKKEKGELPIFYAGNEISLCIKLMENVA